MDAFKFHKLALKPIFDSQRTSYLNEIASLSKTDKEKFIKFIHHHGLGSIWYKLLRKNDGIALFSEEQVEHLKNISVEFAARYLMQKYVLGIVMAIFEEELIPYAIFKGAHLREIIYKEPAIRSSADIDILIHTSKLEKAIKALVDSGFQMEVKQQNISHEITLYSKNVAIDLHWHILRPGRLRMSLTDEFLAKRHDYTTHIGFDVETTLFIMLVHPVFTKYSTTSLASLVRFVDLLEWIKHHPIDWDALFLLLQKYGVCTAAWITAIYLHEVTGERLPKKFLQKIKPSLLKQWYLKNWIKTDLASKLFSKPFLIQFGFTLPAHDTIFDAIRFLKILSIEKKESQLKTERLLVGTRGDPEE